MTTTTATVVLVGCGCPKRSMGWYHAVQMLDKERNVCPSATLKYIVEPWYMSKAGSVAAGGDEFRAWKEELETTKNIQFFESIAGLDSTIPPPTKDERRLAIISARTSDNPKLFADCLNMGCHSIYLEKPGAPTVSELEKMRDAAKAANNKNTNTTAVLMGFNKNVAKFTTKTLDYATKNGGIVTFVHNNNYSRSELGECFERNAEGMLKNMAIHELCLAVTYFGVTVDNIQAVTADKEYSSCQTLKGPSGHNFTDFDRLKFTITTKDGNQVSVAADRCGGDDSIGIVNDSTNGKELFRYSMPDQDDLANISKLEAKYPGAMPYFYVQDPDYATLKERIAKNCVDGTKAEGVATIDVAIETLKVAEYLTPILQEQLLQ